MRGQGTRGQISVSMESSPLYSDSGVNEKSQFMENSSLLGMLSVPPKSKSQEPVAPPEKGREGRGLGDSHSAVDITESQDASIDPYGSYVDDSSFPQETAKAASAEEDEEDEGDYEPMASPEPPRLFDDPDYDNV